MLENLKRKKNVQNRTLKTWLTDREYASFEAAWTEQKELREEVAEKPAELTDYETIMRKGMFYHNRADGYARNGQTAQKFRYKAEAQFERALEHLEECMHADPSLQMWLDRPVDTGPSGEVSPSSPVSMPHVVTSRSADNAGGGYRSMFKTIRETKTDAIERAIDRLKYEQ